MDILIVEDDRLVSGSLRFLVEMDGGHRVVAEADDLSSSIKAVETYDVALALVDIQLARNCTGYGVAAELSRRGTPCIFVTGHAPPFPMPEFALGCIQKPYSAEAVSSALKIAAAIRTGGEVESFESSFQLY